VSDERWARVKELFAEALDEAPDEREGLLARRCPDDASLREEVRTLLVAHESAGSFIEAPPAPVAAARLGEQPAQLAGRDRTLPRRPRDRPRRNGHGVHG
jgi:serine/threonine-protein kinase